MKKIALVLVVALSLVMFVGCQTTRTPVTADKFATKAEEFGYTVQDAMNQFEEGAVKNYLLALKGIDNIDYQIEFAEVHTIEQAIAAYQENYSDFEAVKGSMSSSSTMNMKNYSYYKLTTNGRYHVISRIENTFVYINASVEYKDEIIEFLKIIGY